MVRHQCKNTRSVYRHRYGGVVKCRTIKRLPEEEKWDAELINFMKGTTWQPVPGNKSDHVPVEIHDDGSTPPAEAEDGEAVGYNQVAIEEDTDKFNKVRQGTADDFRVHVKDRDKYGFTPGCPAVKPNAPAEWRMADPNKHAEHQ